MKGPRPEKWYLGGDGEGPMLWNDRNVTLAMSNSTEYEVKKNRKSINQAFRLMVRAPQMDAALRAWVAYDEDESDVEPKAPGGITRVRAMIRKALVEAS